MEQRLNEFGQPIGPDVPGWTARPRPARSDLVGRYCRLEPLDIARHAAELHDANREAPDGRAWTYLSKGPFASVADYAEWLRQVSGDDPFFYAIRDHDSGRASGVAAHMRIDPAAGSIEVGHILFAPRLQRTRAATEAIFLMAQNAFEVLGYRRYEWKCDNLNLPSRAAAERFGFTFEGVFRQATVYRGRSRDTAWFSILDSEWPSRKAAFLAWLAPANFDENGRQRARLRELRNSL